MTGLLIAVLVALGLLIVLSKAAKVVPQQNAWIIERLGKYDRTLGGGMHLLIPFMDEVRYRQSLKEQVMEIEEQDCITRDNVPIKIDGVLYFKVIDPGRASYGVSDVRMAITQLAQTTLRSEIGKIELDRTFEERPVVNAHVVEEIDKASEAWGVKVLRYEIKNIKPPPDIQAAMEKQMRAEREKRATILVSEGERDSLINNAEGRKQQVIKDSEARKQQAINEAEGHAAAILAVAKATAAGIQEVAAAVRMPGGMEAVQLRVAEQYVGEFGKLAQQNNTMILPANLSDVASMIAMAMNVIKGPGGNGGGVETANGSAAAKPGAA